MAIATIRSESRNGIRHPQALNASTPTIPRVRMITTSDTTIPRVGDVWSQPV